MVATNFPLLIEWHGEKWVCKKYIGRPLTLTGLPGSSGIRRKKEHFHSLLAADEGGKAEAGHPRVLTEALSQNGGCLFACRDRGAERGWWCPWQVMVGKWWGKQARGCHRIINHWPLGTQELPFQYLPVPPLWTRQWGWTGGSGRFPTNYPGGSC